MKKFFDFFLWHFVLPMFMGWSLLLLFGFATPDIRECQRDCIGICSHTKYEAQTNLVALDEQLFAIYSVAYLTMDFDLVEPADQAVEKYIGDLSTIFDVYASDVENNTECYIGMQDQILKYPRDCRMVCSSNSSDSCRLVCSTNEINLTWYCSGLTNLFYGASRYNELQEYFLAFTNDLAVIADNAYTIQTNLIRMADDSMQTRDRAYEMVNRLDCDDYCTRCSSNCNVSVSSNCVIECRVVDEDGIYREECSTNCWEGPTTSQCCDFTWLEDLMDDLLDKINSMANALDKLKNWLDKWDTFLGWVDYYSKHPPSDELYKKWQITPFYEQVMDGDIVISNRLAGFTYGKINERYADLTGNFFYDNIRMQGYIFDEVNQANAILASLNTNLSLRLEEKEGLEEITNNIQRGWDDAGSYTGTVFGFTTINTNMFYLADDFSFPELPSDSVYLPSTVRFTVPFEFHNNDMNGGEPVQRVLEMDISEYSQFFELVRSVVIFIYYGVVIFFWLMVMFWVFRIYAKIVKLMTGLVPKD